MSEALEEARHPELLKDHSAVLAEAKPRFDLVQNIGRGLLKLLRGGILHHDLVPFNIMICRQEHSGYLLTPVVIDWGSSGHTIIGDKFDEAQLLQYLGGKHQNEGTLLGQFKSLM